MDFLKMSGIAMNELEVCEFKELAKITFALSDDEFGRLIKMGAYKEVECGEKSEDL